MEGQSLNMTEMSIPLNSKWKKCYPAEKGPDINEAVEADLGAGSRRIGLPSARALDGLIFSVVSKYSNTDQIRYTFQ